MTNASDRARELPPGPELDALFFETCWGWHSCEDWDGLSVGCPPGFWKNLNTIFESLRVGGPAKHRTLTDNILDGYGTIAFVPPATTDAGACEAWAMRWARENGLSIWSHTPPRADEWSDAWIELNSDFGIDSSRGIHDICEEATGIDYKHALVRACIVAKETLNAKEPK